MSAAALIAGLATALATIVCWEFLAGLERVALLRTVAAAIAPAQAAGSDGRGAAVSERRRLALIAAAAAGLLGWSTLGLVPALVLACCGPPAALAVIRARQRRWRRSINHDAAPASRAIADSLAAGHSLSVAVANAASEAAVSNRTRSVLAEVASSIAIGLSPDDALEAMRLRCGDGPWEAIIAAIQLQRRTGGDLSRLLRELAVDLDSIARALREARAASAQSRLTARIVLAMPLLGALIFAAAAPRTLVTIFSSPLPRGLLVLAALLQVMAVVAVRRVARVRQ
ncbi:MAG: type II secretion system F family protein [Solirubrobacteraceae bacterium]|nr:type II secretion system F family protein [Solirubrobacteraceae bacterium]